MAFLQKKKCFQLVPKWGSNSTCKVAAGSLVVAESTLVILNGYFTGRKPPPCCDWPHVSRSKVMSSAPMRYSICTRNRKETSHNMINSLPYLKESPSWNTRHCNACETQVLSFPSPSAVLKLLSNGVLATSS